MGDRVSEDTPLAEVTLRKYERPGELEDRALVRKIVLSLGLLQPGDSRDVVVDVLHVLLDADEPLSSKEVAKRAEENREEHDLPIRGVANSNIRRQLLRLRDAFLVEKVKHSYRINENAELGYLFEENLEGYYLDSIISRVKDYLDLADETFG